MTAELVVRIALQFLLAGLLAAAVTKIVDTLRNAIEPPPLAGGQRRARVPKVIWNLSAFAVGLGISMTGFNAFAGIHPDETVGRVLTGLMLAGGAGGWHELFDRWSTTAKAGRT